MSFVSTQSPHFSQDLEAEYNFDIQEAENLLTLLLFKIGKHKSLKKTIKSLDVEFITHDTDYRVGSPFSKSWTETEIDKIIYHYK